MVEVSSDNPLGTLQEPPPADEIAEHHHVAPVYEDQLEVAPPQGPAGPPAVLDDPLLPQGVHGHRLHRRGCAAVVRLNRSGLGVAEPARAGVWALSVTHMAH